MMKKLVILPFVFIGFAFIFLTVPMPYTWFSKPTKEKFPREEPIALSSNKTERCKEKTVYASEKNGYTEIGEQTFDVRCSNLQMELNKSVVSNNFELATELLAKGANANSPNNDYELQYPILTAVYSKNTQIAKLLLDNGADANYKKCCCASCSRILDIAIKSNDLEMVELLLDHGAKVNLEPAFPDQYSTLMLAARFGNFEMTQLIEEGCRGDLQCRAEFRTRRLWYFLKTSFVKENNHF